MKTGPALTLVAVLAASAISASPAAAQVVRGTVVDSATGQGVQGAFVALVSRSGDKVVGVATAAAGEFVLRAPGAGRYQVRAVRIGYDSATTEPLNLAPDVEIPLLLHLAPRPIPIGAVTAAAPRRLEWLERTGFYYRKFMSSGSAHFLEREDIDRKHALLASDLLHGIPEIQLVRVMRAGGQTVEPIIRAATAMYLRGPGYCQPSIVVDGQVVRNGGTPEMNRGGRYEVATQPSLDELLSPANIEALEIYPSAAGLPPQWSGYVSPCGAIVAWTRR